MQQKIKSPKSKRMITVGGKAYHDLINIDGYTKEQLLGLTPLNDNLTMPNDIMFNVLYQADIDRIENLCFTNKYLNDICHTKQFWHAIFNRDHLPIFEDQNNINQWIVYYRKITKATKEADQLLQLIDYFHTTWFSFNISYAKEILSQFMNNILNIDFDYQFVVSTDVTINNHLYYLSMRYFPSHYEKNTAVLTFDEFKMLFVHILLQSEIIIFPNNGDYHRMITIKDLVKIDRKSTRRNTNHKNMARSALRAIHYK